MILFYSAKHVQYLVRIYHMDVTTDIALTDVFTELSLDIYTNVDIVL